MNNKSSLEADGTTSWRYPTAEKRDLRIDFLRGFAMIIMVVAHIELFSAFNLVTSERLGLISGAEGFVMFSGLVLGQVYRARLTLDGWITSIYKLWSRAWKLYVVSLSIIIIFYLLSFVPFLNTHEVTSFTDRGSNTVYSLYPTGNYTVEHALNRLFYLQSGPHQTQVLGLYIILMLVTPLAFWAFSKGRPWLFLLPSWAVYGYFQATGVSPLHSNFENAFHVLAWQALFFTGMWVGWYKHEISVHLRGPLRAAVIALSVTGALTMFFVALNHTNIFMPSWATLDLIPDATFNHIYETYALKNPLGPLRVFNDFCLYGALYALLTYAWRPLNKLFGWYLIPVGQASLYVFIVHVFIVFAVSQFVSFDLHPGNWVRNTLIHAGSLLLLWWMTRHKVAMNIIPN